MKDSDSNSSQDEIMKVNHYDNIDHVEVRIIDDLDENPYEIKNSKDLNRSIEITTKATTKKNDLTEIVSAQQRASLSKSLLSPQNKKRSFKLTTD